MPWFHPTYHSDANPSRECQGNREEQKAKCRNETEQVTHLTHRDPESPDVTSPPQSSSGRSYPFHKAEESRGTQRPGPACTHPALDHTTSHSPDLCSSFPEESTSLHSPLQVLGCGTGSGIVLGDTWTDSDLGADSLAVSNCGAPPSVIGRAYSRGQPCIFCQALYTHRQHHQAMTNDLSDHSPCSFTIEKTEAQGTDIPWTGAIS